MVKIALEIIALVIDYFNRLSNNKNSVLTLPSDGMKWNHLTCKIHI